MNDSGYDFVSWVIVESHRSRMKFSRMRAILFYAALLPGVVDFASFTATDLAIVAAVLVVVIGGVNAGWAVLGARAGRFFADERALRTVNRVAGALMIAAAVLVATRV